jgi:hypothetical protein
MNVNSAMPLLIETFLYTVGAADFEIPAGSSTFFSFPWAAGVSKFAAHTILDIARNVDVCLVYGR